MKPNLYKLCKERSTSSWQERLVTDCTSLAKKGKMEYIDELPGEMRKEILEDPRTRVDHEMGIIVHFPKEISDKYIQKIRSLFEDGENLAISFNACDLDPYYLKIVWAIKSK